MVDQSGFKDDHRVVQHLPLPLLSLLLPPPPPLLRRRFVNMIDQSGFKDDHLCFAKASNASMAVFDKILELPMKNKTKPSDMNGAACVMVMHTHMPFLDAPIACLHTTGYITSVNNHTNFELSV